MGKAKETSLRAVDLDSVPVKPMKNRSYEQKKRLEANFPANKKNMGPRVIVDVDGNEYSLAPKKIWDNYRLDYSQAMAPGRDDARTYENQLFYVKTKKRGIYYSPGTVAKGLHLQNNLDCDIQILSTLFKPYASCGVVWVSNLRTKGLTKDPEKFAKHLFKKPK
jgi:hypothetical protein